MPLMIENPVRRPMVPPIRLSWASVLIFLSLLMLSKVAVSIAVTCSDTRGPLPNVTEIEYATATLVVRRRASARRPPPFTGRGGVVPHPASRRSCNLCRGDRFSSPGRRVFLPRTLNRPFSDGWVVESGRPQYLY